MSSVKLILTILLVLISLTWTASSINPISITVTLPLRTKRSLGSIAMLQEEFTNKDDSDGKGSPRIYSMEIETDIRLRYATTRVSSRVANPYSSSKEAIFYIALPETAFISSFLMETEGQVYKALVKEKEEAQNEYNKAVSTGRTAGLVSNRNANQFTVSVSIESNSKVDFILTYEQLLTRRQGFYEHTVHINPGAIVPELRVRTNIFEILPISEIKILPFGNDIGDEFGKETTNIVNFNATSSTILFEPTEKQQKKISESGLDGHLTIHYDVDRSSLEGKGGEIHVVDGYFVHFFAPSSLPILPKHVVFVLDTSGSMRGIRIQQTKEAMETILDQLHSKDIFSVVEFSSKSKQWDLTKNYESIDFDDYDEVVRETTESDLKSIPARIGDYDDIFAYSVSELSIKLAKSFVRQMKANGGTNINDALVLALKNTQALLSRTKRTPIIIFLTDGEPTVGQTVHKVITQNVRKANSDGLVSIFSLAFGFDADFSLLKKISGENRGFARKIYEAADTTLQLEGFFSEVASPLLNDVHFTYEGLVTDVTEAEIPNFFNGTEWCTLGRILDSSPLPFRAVVEATGSDGPLVFSSNNTLLSKKGEKKSFSLEKMWAYSTIQHLLKQSEIDTNNTSLKERALNLSLTYEFVTPLTSLIVIKPRQNATTNELQSTSSKQRDFQYQAPYPGSTSKSSKFHSTLLLVGGVFILLTLDIFSNF